MNKLIKIYCTIFYVGYIKFAPGTFGTLVSIPIVYFLNYFLDIYSLILVFIFLLIFTILTINIFSKHINKHDAKEIIIDEFLGIYLIFIFYDYFLNINEFLKLLFIFIFFRFFDIIKLFPANYVDKNLKNSTGIILDDLIAGIYSLVILYILNEFI